MTVNNINPCTGKNILSILRYAIIGVIVLYPVIVINSWKANELFFYLLILLSIIAIFTEKFYKNRSFFLFLKKYWPLFFSFVFVFLSELITQIFKNGLNLKLYDVPIRFLFFPVLLFGVSSLSSKDIKYVQFGLIFAAIVNMIWFCFLTDFGESRNNDLFQNIKFIPYSDIALLIGFLSFALMGVDWKGNKMLAFMKFMAFLCGLSVAFLSHTRGAWIAIPFLCFICCWLFFKMGIIKIKMLSIATLFFFALCGVLVFYSSALDRVQQVQSEIQLYSENSNKGTSIGLRFEMYKASVLIATENILIGVGGDHYKNEINKLIENERVSKDIAGFHHMHNELLHHLLVKGIFGVFSILVIYIMPVIYCIRLSSDEFSSKSMAYAGIVFGVAFFIFGLTETFFVRKTLVNCYIVFYSIFIAFLIKIKSEANEVEKC